MFRVQQSFQFPAMETLTSPAQTTKLFFFHHYSDHHCCSSPHSLLSRSTKFPHFSPLSSSSKLKPLPYGLWRCRRRLAGENDRIRVPAPAPANESERTGQDYESSEELGLRKGEDEMSFVRAVLEVIPEANYAIVLACLVGLFTGLGVVLFNYVVHELRDFFWDGVLNRGASWLREEPLEITWQRTISVPVCGGLLVSLLNGLRDSLDVSVQGDLKSRLKGVLQPFLKILAACITLGTGNSLGPEGPSVEIGSSIAKGVGTLFGSSSKRKIPLVAAGSAAGIASGFNAAVAGCFFAVESVLWPSPDSSESLTNTTSMVIISAVIASVLSEVGLGAEPAFKVPLYDFRSASELPLYLLLGILCGLVSLALTRSTTFMLRTVEDIQNSGRIPKAVFPVTGGLAVGLMALAYPEILYWGFQNVDLLLESQPFVKGLSADLLIQIVGVKIIATSFCRASGLVGGYYAPSLFIGAGTGMAYGKLVPFAVSQFNPIFQSPLFEVASPKAYALVGMAATLAGVCQVPLTAVLLLFELTQDYRIVLPLLAAVGTSAWITSPRVKRREWVDVKKVNDNMQKTQDITSKTNPGSVSFGYSSYTNLSNADNICELESSRCFDDSDDETEELQKKIFVAQAMRTRFATVSMNTLLVDAVGLMVAEKQSFALIVDDDNYLLGILSLEKIEEFSKSSEARTRKPEEPLVADMCSLDHKKCQVLWTATPLMDLLSAEMIMVRHGLSLLPVVSEHGEGCRGQPVGVIDMPCIILACRAFVTKEYLNQNLVTEGGGRE